MFIFLCILGGSSEGEKCTSEQFQCGEKSTENPNGGKCIPKRWQCDYHRDCENGEDEIDCRKYIIYFIFLYFLFYNKWVGRLIRVINELLFIFSEV